jgi:hypothetical protein
VDEVAAAGGDIEHTPAGEVAENLFWSGHKVSFLRTSIPQRVSGVIPQKE